MAYESGLWLGMLRDVRAAGCWFSWMLKVKVLRGEYNFSFIHSFVVLKQHLICNWPSVGPFSWLLNLSQESELLNRWTMKLLHLNTKESFAPHRHNLYSTRAFVSERFSFGLLWDAAPDLWGAVLIPGGTMPCDRKCVRAVVYLLPDTSLRVIGKSLVFPFFFCFLSKSHDVLCSCEPLRLFFFSNLHETFYLVATGGETEGLPMLVHIVTQHTVTPMFSGYSSELQVRVMRWEM